MQTLSRLPNHVFAFVFVFACETREQPKTKTKAWTTLLLAAFAALGSQGDAAAQGTGATGAQVLQFVAGSRAPALSGAYTAGSGDADALFYNPAGVATLSRAGVLAYETYVEDIALASLGGVVSLGRFTLGLGAIHLRGGSIEEFVPDPEFGGNRGMATGLSLSADETVARLSLATSFGDRLRFGASAGLVDSSIANESSRTPLFDLGGQYEFSFATIGLALRNIGPQLSGDGLRAASLPTEARLGAAAQFARADGLGVTVHTDLIARINEGSAGVLVGVEGGWQAGSERSLGAVGRIGYSAAEGEGGLGALSLGAGLTMSRITFDYTFQNLEFLGAVHRFGLRWSVMR